MNSVRIALFVVTATLSFGLNAADLPTVVEGSEQFSYEECLANSVNDCVESVCMTSSELDCQDQCKDSAKDECEEKLEQ